MVTEALAAVTAVTEEEGSEVEGDAALGEMAAAVMGSGAVVVALATTEEDINAASVKLLITEVTSRWTDKTDCHSSGLAVVFIGCQ